MKAVFELHFTCEVTKRPCMIHSVFAPSVGVAGDRWESELLAPAAAADIPCFVWIISGDSHLILVPPLALSHYVPVI